MSNKIPKQTQVGNKSIIPKPPTPVSGGISFSFEILETTEYFNIDSTCANWSSELFDMMSNVCKIEKEHLLSGMYSKYRVHPHGNAKPPSPFPKNINAKDCYQIRISKSKGGIHGVFYENIFYVIWLDPLHNMYPDERYGGLKKIVPPKTCCMDREEELNILKQENEKLKEEIKEYEELFNT